MFKLSAIRKLDNHVSKTFVRGLTCKNKTKLKSCVLRCKVIIITGAGEGIGLALAKAFVENGAHGVVMVDTDEAASVEHMREINKSYGENKALFQKADATNKKELEHVFECTIKRFQRLDAVVNTAGLWNDPEWEKIMWANTLSTINGTELGMHYMVREHFGKGGDILNVIHIDGLIPRFTFPIGSASENFQLGYTKAMAHDSIYEKTNIRVMGLFSGLTLTKRISDIRLIIENREKDVREIGDLSEEIVKIGSEPVQCGTDLGQAAVDILKEGKNGQFFIAEDRKFCKTTYDLSHLIKKKEQKLDEKDKK